MDTELHRALREQDAELDRRLASLCTAAPNDPPTIEGMAAIVDRFKEMMAPDDTALVLMPTGAGEFAVHKVSADAMRVVLASGGVALKPGQGR